MLHDGITSYQPILLVCHWQLTFLKDVIICCSLGYGSANSAGVMVVSGNKFNMASVICSDLLSKARSNKLHRHLIVQHSIPSHGTQHKTVITLRYYGCPTRSVNTSLFFSAYSNARSPIAMFIILLYEVTVSVRTCIRVKHQLEGVKTK